MIVYEGFMVAFYQIIDHLREGFSPFFIANFAAYNVNDFISAIIDFKRLFIN